MAAKSGENPNFTPLHRTLLYYPAGQKFARNRSISYDFRDIYTFSFSTKIQDGRQKWRKSKFYPFSPDTLVLPCGSKIRSKSLYLLRFSRYSHFFIYCKKSKMATKSGENPNFTPLHRTLLYYPAGQKFARNHSISYGFRDIHTFSFSAKIQDGCQMWRKSKFFAFAQNTLVLPAGQNFARNLTICYGFQDIHTFSFTAKIQDGRQKWRKLKVFPFPQDTLVLPCGSKIRSKSLYLLRFSRYSHFLIFRKNLRWPPKIEILPLCIGHSSMTLWVKNSLEIALSLTVLEIFTLFHFPQKSKMAVKSGEN